MRAKKLKKNVGAAVGAAEGTAEGSAEGSAEGCALKKMPPKKAYSSLTGGSGDVSPQYYNTGVLSMSAPNTFTQLALALPINRLQTRDGKVTVMEFLKVYWNPSEPDANPPAGGGVVGISGALSTSSTTSNDPSNPKTVAWMEKQVRGSFTAAGTYGTVYYEPVVWDFTDGAGHGVLVATDTLYMAVSSIGFIGAGSISAKILYRFKDVSLEEYIGIVQSQQ